AENLQINADIEQFLTTVCTCRIQVKIAFANWRSMGKLDIEFHQRGYDLIHVPAGRDNADGKMIAFGSSIHEHYPKAKEVLVCSSDTVMTNLCNHLQKNGLTVYQVSKQGNNITILNSKSAHKYTHSLLKPPSIEELITQIKSIIISQEKRTSNQWFKLSQISQIYYKKYNFNISEVVSYSLPGKITKDIFLDKSEFVVYELPEDKELYVALFKMPQLNKAVSNDCVENKQINTKTDLEQSLVAIINALAGKYPTGYIPIETLSANFNNQYGQGIIDIFKKLELSVKYVTFLKSCDSFELQKIGDRWHVALRQAKSVTA
ncbi:MAG: NYN domain-containing protein, partial [Hassallia sp.]